MPEKSDGPSLDQYVETRLNLLDKRIEKMEETIFELINERDRRYQQRFEDQNAALYKQAEAVEKRFESVNEFRNALSDLSKTMMPRFESSSRHEATANKIDDLSKATNATIKALQDRIEMRVDRSKDDSRATWAIVISVGGVITAALIAFFRGSGKL